MKRLFSHRRKNIEEWDGYDSDGFDWDELGEYKTDESETYVDEENLYGEEGGEAIYYAEDGENLYGEEGGEAIYYAEEEENLYGEEGGEAIYYAEDGENLYGEEGGEAIYYAEDEENLYGEEGGEAIYYAEDGENLYGEENGEAIYYAEDGENLYSEENGEAIYYPEDGEITYSEGEEFYEGDVERETEYYVDETGEYYIADENEAYYEERNGRNDNFFMVLWTKFLEMGVMDRVVTVTGIAVLLLALVTGVAYVGSKAGDDQVTELASVGSQLEGINLIGEKGLMAIADAEMARQAAAEIVDEEENEQKEYEEGEYSNAVTVKLSMTSVMKDLKIKFTNKETGKLIANVPFSVTVTMPDGNSENWTDDDMDGIIYRKNIAAGAYKVRANELANPKYEDYTIPSDTQSVEVKKDIAYEKIDVSDEVKTEAEIDASKEDTKINETVVESTLQDTVAWVESTAIAETYTEVSKSKIPDPTTLAMSKSFVRTAANAPAVSGGNAGNIAFNATIEPSTISVAIDGTAQTKVTASGQAEGVELKYSVVSNNTEVATAKIDKKGNITITGVAAGTATVTATVDYAKGASLPVTATLKVTVLDTPVITLDKTTATVYLTEPVTLNAKVMNALTNVTIIAESSNTEVATVAVNDKEVTITGVAAGDATITVKYSENNQETKATCVVKVMTHPKDNKTDKLEDADGNQLYVRENEDYREAVYADYYTADKFFIKGDVKYTGWQTLNGNVYYFTAAGEKVTGEHIIQGAKYNFASDGSLITGSGTLGIDVSKWNGNIDWNAVKNSGVSYVIIRCGYRGSSQGMLVEDPKFKKNIKGALDAGLKVGVYFFTQATDEVEAVEEASFVLDLIKNYKISYPVFLDVEPSGGRGDKIDVATRTAVCKAFCETIQRSGYTAGIYANKTWLNEKMNTESLGAYKIWLAQYAAAPTYTGRYDMWQYKSTGRVSGISGDVDMNLSYLGY